MIDSREELIHALSEAAEIEHGLMLQYLFAALSLKRRTGEQISARQQAMIVDWEAAILAVAQDEMRHLHEVCRLLLAIGASPHLDRPNFPQPMESYYPFDFQLEKFNERSLCRFIIAEIPEKTDLPDFLSHAKAEFMLSPEPVKYNRVGELYEQILEGFRRIPSQTLFVAPRNQPGAIRDFNAAGEVIRKIILEGEGSPADRRESHYGRFLWIYQKFTDEQRRYPEFDPARPVVSNPRTRDHRDARTGGTLITHPTTRKLAELFNHIYSTLLLMLTYHYNFAGESPSQRAMVERMLTGIMTMMIRPLSELLTEMPAGTAGPFPTAGPGFEIYSPLRPAVNMEMRWIMLRERLETHIQDCKELTSESTQFKVLTRLNGIHENLGFLLKNLQKEFEG